MSDNFAEAISTDDSPAPEPPRARNVLLGDPKVEGNEHLLDWLDDEPHGRRTPKTDDIHAPLANADVQN